MKITIKYRTGEPVSFTLSPEGVDILVEELRNNKDFGWYYIIERS
jgi:hypothetical protein